PAENPSLPTRSSRVLRWNDSSVRVAISGLLRSLSRPRDAESSWCGLRLSGLPMPGDEWVLDMGCARGGVMAMVAKLVPQGHVVGLDLLADTPTPGGRTPREIAQAPAFIPLTSLSMSPTAKQQL